MTQPSWTRNLRGILGLVIFGGLFWFIDLRALGQTFLEIRLGYLLLLVFLSALLIWVSCLKWRLFLRAYGRDADMPLLMRLYTIGYFFNLFMPSFVGGDIARSLELGRRIESKRDAFVSTFLERFTGFVAMAMLGSIFALVGFEATAGVRGAIVLIGTVALVATAVCFCERASCLFQQIVVRGLTLPILRRWQPFLERLALKILDAFAAARKRKNLLLTSLALSFVSTRSQWSTLV